MALHPRYQEYGLGDGDETFVRSFRFAAQRAGWSRDRVDGALGWFKEVSPQLGSMDADARVRSFIDYATSRGWQMPDVEAALGWFDATATRLERGETPEVPPAPSRAQDAVRLAELQKLMRDRPDDYFKNPDFAEELYDIAARGETSSPAAAAPARPAAPSPQGGAQPGAGAPSRRAELERLMGDGGSDYWRQPALQAEYRQLVGGDQSAPGAIEPAGGAAMDAAAAAGGPST